MLRLILIIFSLISIAISANAVTCKRSDFDKGLKVMAAVDKQSKSFSTQTSDVAMDIIDESGAVRKRLFNLYKKNFANVTKSLIKFYEPSNIKNTSLLSYSYQDKDSEQWFFFPALRSIKKLNVSDRNSSFMGSDFSNSDIAGRSLGDYNYCFVSENGDHFYINSFPKSRSDQYSRLEIKVIKSIDVVAQIKFYNKSKKMVKTLLNEKIKKVNKSFIVVDSKMLNHKTGGRTVIRTNSVDLDKSISSRFFGVKNLR